MKKLTPLELWIIGLVIAQGLVAICVLACFGIYLLAEKYLL